MLKIIQRLVDAFRERVTLDKIYLINGKRVTEEEWKAAGGEEVIKELHRAVEEMKDLFKEK